ncbi:MAG TPA: Hsp70 family protein [Mycobacterium sp.]|uniref:Hsp70 family protein n=1 Tax=Mycobacterium sp. TaxID=1785 RepID=UPI002B82E00B|nr:Hsp70 family protein [Mycobacterium sp.]HXO81036.1 Hsp70 family protein [Mycobacterium sp.]
MADGEGSALGLSIGATNLAAVTADRAVTRKPVLTLYSQRSPEVGVPAENPRLNEPGLVISDFVDRAGDPAGVAAADGSTYRSETLVADALRALAYTATDGRPLPDAVAVTHPAHWDALAVDSVGVALSRVSEWSRGRLALLPDSTAALFALRMNPGLPDSGTVAVCDFGGSGATISLVDAANGYQAIVPAVRTEDFSGDRIDQAVLTHVVGDLSSAGSFDSSATSAIGSLNGLRTACRYAKERLSSTMETELTAEVPGYRGEIRLSRTELEDAIRQPLNGFIDFLHEVLERNGIRPTDLAAIASVGGGASIPLITRTLSEQSGALVVTAPRPHLTAAVGAALRAARGPGDSETALAPTSAGSALDAMTLADIPRAPASAPALAWSEADDDSGIMPLRPGEYDDEPADGAGAPLRARPRRDLAPEPIVTGASQDAWYRRPLVVAMGTALAVLAIVAAVVMAIRYTSSNAPTPSVSTTPATSSENQAPSSNPASSTAPDTSTAPSTTSEAPTTTTTTGAPSTTTTTSQPATTTTQDSGRPDRPRFPRDRDGRLFPGR